MSSTKKQNFSRHGYYSSNGNGNGNGSITRSNGNGHTNGNGNANGHINGHINGHAKPPKQSIASPSPYKLPFQTPTKRSTPAAPASRSASASASALASKSIKKTTREQALAEANDVLSTIGYKQGRFENFNLLGVVTSPRMLEHSRHGNGTSTTASSSEATSTSTSNNMNSISSASPAKRGSMGMSNNNNNNTTPNTPSSFSALGLDSYVDSNFLSNISNVTESFTKEIESLNSTIYSYSRNYLGNYTSLSNAYGVSSVSDMRMTSSSSSLDFENELLQSILNDGVGGEYYKVRSMDEMPSELVDLDLSSVEGYLRKCGMLAHKFDKELRLSKRREVVVVDDEEEQQQQQQQQQQQKQPREEEGEYNLEAEENDTIAMIPDIFFSPHFDLTDPKTFESLLVMNDDDIDDINNNDEEGGSGGGGLSASIRASMRGRKNDKSNTKSNTNTNTKTPIKSNTTNDIDPIIRIQKPEQLTQYLDTVELGLLNQVRSKSDSFFRETNRFSYLKSLVADLVNEVQSLQGELEQIRERSITEVELIPVMDRRRKDIKVLGLVLDEILDVVEVKGSVAGLIAAGDFLGAVEAIHMARNLLNGKGGEYGGRYVLGKVVALNKVNDQLAQYENLVVMDLSNDVVQLFLSWNDGIAEAEMRVKVKHTILALKKCQKLSTMADIYREKLCETIRVTIRTTVSECAVDAAKDSKDVSSIPSATIVSIPNKGGGGGDDFNTKTSITEGVTSMTFEQFIDCLDMIFEQSLSLLRSAAAVNKFCLEEGISLKEDESSRDVSALSAASDLSHKSISEILRLRKDAHSLIAFVDMRRLWDSCLAFTLQVEKISGQKAYGLRSTLLAQAKGFVERKHEANMSSLVAALDGERWSQCDVSAERQASLERLCTGRAVLSSTRDRGFTGGVDVTDASPFASVEGTKYRVVWSCLLLIEHIMSNVACAAHFQTLATNVVGKVSELLRLFNARATQLVLGAGAIHSAARLKSINAKHLALVTQCVGIVLSILPHVRAALMAQLPNKQHALLVDLDKIKKEYAEHHDKVLSKFVGIIGGIVEHNLVTRIANTNFDERSKLPNAEELKQNSCCCPFLDGIMTNTRKMHQVLVSLLPSDDLMDVFSRILSYLDSKVPKILIDADMDEKTSFRFPTSVEGKRRMVMEVKILSMTLNSLPNVRPWDFGAMKFLERKLELPSVQESVSDTADVENISQESQESQNENTTGETIENDDGANQESNSNVDEVTHDTTDTKETLEKEVSNDETNKSSADNEGKEIDENITPDMNEKLANSETEKGSPANVCIEEIPPKDGLHTDPCEAPNNICEEDTIPIKKEEKVLETGANTIGTVVSSSSMDQQEEEGPSSSVDEQQPLDDDKLSENTNEEANQTHVTSPSQPALSQYIRTS